MNEWQDRLTAEATELSSRIEELEEFITSDAFSELDDIDRKLLVRQRDLMVNYHRILGQRISRF